MEGIRFNRARRSLPACLGGSRSLLRVHDYNFATSPGSLLWSHAVPSPLAFRGTHLIDAQHLTVKLYRKWDELEDLLPDWNQFASQSSAWTLCATREWLTSWWLAYGETRELFVLAAFDPNDELVGVAPLYRVRDGAPLPKRSLQTLRFLGTGTGGTSTNLGFISRRGLEVEVTQCLLHWLSESRATWDVLDLHLMPAEWLSTIVLLRELEIRGWTRVRSRDHHRVVVFPDTYDAYTATLSKRMRTELPYEHRRLLKAFRTEVRKLETEAEVAAGLQILMRLNSQRWQARDQLGSFGVPEKRRLAQALSQRFLACGWLDFWVLELDGQTAAMEFAFRIDGVFYPLWVALDTQYKDYSPGAVLKALIIERLINDGVRVYEFMQGAEPYKARWGIEERKYDTATCARPFSRAALLFRLDALQFRARRFARRHASRWTSKLRSVWPGTIAKSLGSPEPGDTPN